MIDPAQSSRQGVWHRVRFQLSLMLLVGALLPYVARLATMPTGESIELLNTTLIGVGVAIVIGFFLSRNVSYPGVEASASIFPCYGISFGLLFLLFVFGRLNYYRSTLLAGFLLTLLVAYLLSLIRRRQRMRIGLLPFGAIEQLRQIGNVDWFVLSSPDAPVKQLDAVAVDLRSELPPEWHRRLADFALSHMPVFHSKHLMESLTGRVELEHLSENSFGSLVPERAYMFVKHSMDWVAAAVVGIALLPLLLAVAGAIRLTSPGPALFRQRRVGYRGQVFMVYKFRTMRMAGSMGDERSAAITQADDQRVTRLGRFLRTSRIDELPQLINVLLGQMSWIGPRPEAEVLSRWYQSEISFYRYRHIVRPGIAGWAQVNQGHVAEVAEVRSKLYYDFYYIKNYSPWLDLLIVALTVRTMLTGFGSR